MSIRTLLIRTLRDDAQPGALVHAARPFDLPKIGDRLSGCTASQPYEHGPISTSDTVVVSPTWGCLASILGINTGEASRRRQIVVKELATKIIAEDNLTLAA